MLALSCHAYAAVVPLLLRAAITYAFHARCRAASRATLMPAFLLIIADADAVYAMITPPARLFSLLPRTATLLRLLPLPPPRMSRRFR